MDSTSSSSPFWEFLSLDQAASQLASDEATVLVSCTANTQKRDGEYKSVIEMQSLSNWAGSLQSVQSTLGQLQSHKDSGSVPQILSTYDERLGMEARKNTHGAKWFQIDRYDIPKLVNMPNLQSCPTQRKLPCQPGSTVARVEKNLMDL
jgi:hypothetical protein